MNIPRRQLLRLAGLAAASVVARPAIAQTYPTRPIKFIVPFTAGGSTYVVGRTLSEKLQTALNLYSQGLVLESIKMLDQVLEIAGIVPDFDLDVMKPDQSLDALTATLLTGLGQVMDEVQPARVMVQGDTATAIATVFALEINRGYTGVWASASGGVLTITSRTIGSIEHT